MNDNIPLNNLAISFDAYARAYMELVRALKKAGLDAESATVCANELSAQFLNYTNQNKFAESVAGLEFVPDTEG